MKRFLSAMLSVIMIFSVCVSWGEEEDSEQILPILSPIAFDKEKLDTELRGILKTRKTTGAVIVVAKGGDILYELDYGYMNKNEKLPVTEQTYFRTASVTKMISAIGVMQLVEEGLLDLDEPIGTYLGYDVPNPYYKDSVITLRMLMSHTAGLSVNGGYSSHADLSSMLDVTKKHKANFYQRRPGSKYEYSNFGAGIMGVLVECVTGKTVQNQFSESFFEPLGISAAYHVQYLPDKENISEVYNLDGTRKYKVETLLKKNPYSDDINPEQDYRQTVGSIWTDGRDLCKIGMLLANGGSLDGVKILEKETVEEMMSSQKGKGGITCSSPYGLCINRIENLVDGTMIYGHQGLDDDILCNLYFEPESQFVFAFISNGTNNKMLDRIANTTRKVFAPVWKVFMEDTE